MEKDLRQLIDLAIGSPIGGHVNFKALHLLLSSIVDKLEELNQPVFLSSYKIVEVPGSAGEDNGECHHNVEFVGTKHVMRLAGGAEPEEAETEAVEGENAPETPQHTEQIEPEKEVAENEPNPQAPEPAGTAAASEMEVQGEEEENVHSEEPKLSLYIETKRESAPEDCMGNYLEELKRDNLYHGVAVMKDQLELTIEQVLQLAEMLIAQKTTAKSINALRFLNEKINAIKKENIYIASGFALHLNESYSHLDFTEGEEIEEESSKQNLVEECPTVSQPCVEGKQYERFGLDGHLCYSPEKLLDQLLDLKSDVCRLANEVKYVSTCVIEQERQRTSKVVNELDKQLKEFKVLFSDIPEAVGRLETLTNNHSKLIEELQEAIDEKVDKSELEALLAKKADISDLERKVSQDQLVEMKCRVKKEFCDVRKAITTSETNMFRVLENMRTELGIASVDQMFREFKGKIDVDINDIRESLRKYVEMTDDKCAAAGARKKVLQDLACISCDTPCVMHKTERAKLPKFPDAPLRNAAGALEVKPLITKQKPAVKSCLGPEKEQFRKCVPRHAGGPHTAHTPGDTVRKVTHSKKF